MNLHQLIIIKQTLIITVILDLYDNVVLFMRELLMDMFWTEGLILFVIKQATIGKAYKSRSSLLIELCVKQPPINIL